MWHHAQLLSEGSTITSGSVPPTMFEGQALITVPTVHTKDLTKANASSCHTAF